MKPKTKIVFLCGDDIIDFKVLYCLFFVFSEIHIIANNENSILKFSRYKKKFTFIPWSVYEKDQELTVQVIKEYLIDNSIEFIMTGGSESSAFLHKYRYNFNFANVFPTMDNIKLEQIDNKWKFAQILISEGISTPATLYIDSKDMVASDNREAIENRFIFPLIVKPVHGDGGQGVCKVNSFEELQEHILGNHSYNSLPLIIQDFIDGYDIDLSFIAENGTVLSQAVQKWTDEEVLEFCRHEEIEQLGEKIIRLFNYSGAGHFDMRIDYKTGKAYVIECNPRFWRSITAAMWSGLNFAETAVNSGMGLPYKKEGANGSYIMPGEKIRMIIRKPWLYFSLPKIFRKEVWYILGDPLPHIVSFIRNKFE